MYCDATVLASSAANTGSGSVASTATTFDWPCAATVTFPFSSSGVSRRSLSDSAARCATVSSDTSPTFVAASRAGSTDGARTCPPNRRWSKPGSRNRSFAVAVYCFSAVSEYASAPAGSAMIASTRIAMRRRNEAARFRTADSSSGPLGTAGCDDTVTFLAGISERPPLTRRCSASVRGRECTSAPTRNRPAAVASLRPVTTKLADLPLIASGKGRDMYDMGDRLLMVASDRISTYDVVHPTPIPDKGKVLTALSVFWFELTGEIVPHHLISATEGVPDEARGRA